MLTLASNSLEVRFARDRRSPETGCSGTIPLEDVNEAFDALADGSAPESQPLP